MKQNLPVISSWFASEQTTVCMKQKENCVYQYVTAVFKP